MIFIQILTNKTTLNLVLQQSLKKIIEQPIFLKAGTHRNAIKRTLTLNKIQ